MVKPAKNPDKGEKQVDRLLLVLRMIPRRGRISTTEIQGRLKAEHSITIELRTVQRDLVDLSRLYPLVSDGERSAGWSWMEDAPSLDLPIMDPFAALTFLLVRDSMTRMLPRAALTALSGYFRTADERLKKLPNSPLSHWPDKVRMVSRSLNFEAPNIDKTVLDSLYEALQHGQCFELEYRVRSGKDKKYVVNPLGLVFVDNLIYLVATLYDYGDVKQLLAHRMKSIRLLPDRPATIPDGFTLQGYIDSGEFGYPLGGMIQLKSLFDKGAAPYLYETKLASNQKLTEQSDGKLLLEVTVRDDIQLRRWLKGFGEQVEVVEPAELRQVFINSIQSLVTMYGGTP
ncbi:MAG TPA: WYL domain-containing protein [Desulfuromonadales bacterium]|nr:WYL domain-containing protein [Desulfuromonadales bacterium]